MIRNLTRGLLCIAVVYLLSLGIQKYYLSSCDSPITYKIGTFDTKFGISEKNFISDLEEATNVWSTLAGKELFKYDPHGDLVINLMYDERQKTTEQNKQLETDIQKTASLADSLKNQYETLNTEVLQKKEVYARKVAEFDADNKAYEERVNYWNTQGRAPSQEYESLTTTQHDLELRQKQLEAERVELNADVVEVNTLIQKYNLLVRDANTTITTLNKSAGKEFQEGSYDPNTNTISIYEFSTKAKLLRIMAHEFGHALKLDHNSNPESIMYELNQGVTLTPTNEDGLSLQKVCQL